MKIYKTRKEVEADIKDGVLSINEDVIFECSISIEASIVVNGNITSWNITAHNIIARNITARNITAWDITARNITAWDISYYAFCCVYEGIKCKSIESKAEKSQKPICSDGELEIKSKKVKVKLTGGEIVEGEIVD